MRPSEDDRLNGKGVFPSEVYPAALAFPTSQFRQVARLENGPGQLHRLSATWAMRIVGVRPSNHLVAFSDIRIRQP
jgi:hypothetical protein